MLFYFVWLKLNICHLTWNVKRTQENKKRPGLAHFLNKIGPRCTARLSSNLEMNFQIYRLPMQVPNDGRLCDQMPFIVFIICPFTAVKNCGQNLTKSVTIFAKY